METSLALIEICKIGMIVSIIISVVGIGLAVLMFFKYDIRTIHAIRTGKAEAISVRKMNEDNLKTGQIQKEIDLDFTTGNLKSKKLKNKSGKLDKPVEFDTPDMETMPLSEAQTDGAEYLIDETVIPSNAAAPVNESCTTVLHQREEQQEKCTELPIKFDIIEEIIIIHTDEVVK